jgi:hypothetical protein
LLKFFVDFSLPHEQVEGLLALVHHLDHLLLKLENLVLGLSELGLTVGILLGKQLQL